MPTPLSSLRLYRLCQTSQELTESPRRFWPLGKGIPGSSRSRGWSTDNVTAFAACPVILSTHFFHLVCPHSPCNHYINCWNCFQAKDPLAALFMLLSGPLLSSLAEWNSAFAERSQGSRTWPSHSGTSPSAWTHSVWSLASPAPLPLSLPPSRAQHTSDTLPWGQASSFFASLWGYVLNEPQTCAPWVGIGAPLTPGDKCFPFQIQMAAEKHKAGNRCLPSQGPPRPAPLPLQPQA